MHASSKTPAAVVAHLARLAARLEKSPRQVQHELAQVPLGVIDSVLDEQRDQSWQGDDRLRLLQLLATDTRDYVRLRAASELGSLAEPSEARQRLLRALCNDAVLSVRRAATSSLAGLLVQLDSPGRTHLVGSWALSPYANHRAAIALALRWPVPVVGAATTVELLSTDEDADVRAAAAEAAKIRLKEAPLLCHAILSRLADDPDPKVRKAAMIGPPAAQQETLS